MTKSRSRSRSRSLARKSKSKTAAKRRRSYARRTLRSVHSSEDFGLSMLAISSPRKKYNVRSRKSPPLPANSPCMQGKMSVGNDGRMYQSRRASNGVYRWQRA